MPDAGLYHPDAGDRGACANLSLAEFQHCYWREHRPAIGILFYRAYWQSGDLALVDGLAREIEARGYNVLPVFCYSLREESAKAASANIFSRYFVNNAGPTVDCVISLFSYAVAELLREERTTTAGGQMAAYIAGKLYGNIFVMIQPPRGFGENPLAVYHSGDLIPTHHYLGAYHWLRHVIRADALVQCGKHGTLEWLPGKGIGLSESCYPELAIGDLPVFYPFIFIQHKARYRLFSNKPGSYGTGILTAITESNWETSDDLARIYLETGRSAAA